MVYRGLGLGSHIGFGDLRVRRPPSSDRRGSSRSSRRSRSSRGSRSSGVGVVEVVDVVEVVVLGSSSWQTLAFRSSGSTGFTASGCRRSCRVPVFEVHSAHEGDRHKRSSNRRTWCVVVVWTPVVFTVVVVRGIGELGGFRLG